MALSARLRRLWDRLFGRFYEGPEAPARLTRVVDAFRALHPSAGPEEWASFAMAHARECYRQGFVRGFEHAERDPRSPEVDPETIADAVDPGWRDRVHDWEWDPVLDGEGVVGATSPEERMERAERAGKSFA